MASRVTAGTPLRILQVNTRDVGGGAERIAWELFMTSRNQGYSSWFAVGDKRSNHSAVLPVNHEHMRSSWSHLCLKLAELMSPLVGTLPGAGRLRKHLRQEVAEPRRWLGIYRGREDFDFPATWSLLDLPERRPQLIHAHNLHGSYFDLRVLPWLSRQVPVLLTLHDAWLFSGHCAHSFECDRWRHGCGNCPDLSIYPSIRRDATAYNWRRKRDIFRESRVYVATPSQWLMDKVLRSILEPAIVSSRVIPNGVDVETFKPPVDKRCIRSSLGLPDDSIILLFAANTIRSNRWKDFETLNRAVKGISEVLSERDVLFVALGEDSPSQKIGSATIKFIPFQHNPEAVARYYQAADLYLHAAKADTFPTTILEALACGLPVVATAVGGIGEQVKSPGSYGVKNGTTHDVSQATGALVPGGDARAMSAAAVDILTSRHLHSRLSRNAVRDVRQRFNASRQTGAYIDWYREIILKENAKTSRDEQFA